MSNLDTELKAVNTALSVIQVLGLMQRLSALALDAISKGQTHVSTDEMQASVAGDDAAMAALRAAIERAEDR